MTWWRRLLQRGRVERELDAEIRDHVDRQVADYVRGGLSESEARRRVRLEFGGLDQVKEACRDARGTRWADELLQDLRHGARLLRLSPGFTAVAALSLALGIGANTAIFSLVDRLLLRSLPVEAPEALAMIEGGSWTNPIWEQVRERQHDLFAGAAAWGNEGFDLAHGGEARIVPALIVSGSFFDLLGVPAVLGRTLTPADDRRGGGPDGPVVVISHRFWQRQFGGAADAIGRTLTLNRSTFTIVGVTPPEFFGPILGQSYDVALPIGSIGLVMESGDRWLDSRSTWWLDVMVRLKPGQSVEDGTTALRGVQNQIREATLPAEWPQEYLDEYLREGLTLVPAAAGPSFLRTTYQRPLLTILVVVALVLLIACANIANLLLARAAGRRHELSVRLALGASRWRLARQLLVESLLLSTLGAAAGLAFASWGSRFLVNQLETPRTTIFLDLGVDWRVLAFTAAVACGTALLFGIAPAFRAGRVEPNEVLKEQGRRLVGEGRRFAGTPLLVAQVALSLVLVVAAGLFVRTFVAMASLDLGFDRDPVLIVSVDAQRGVADPDARLAVARRLVEAVAALPGVSHAALSHLTPLSGMGWNGTVAVKGGAVHTGRDRMSYFNAVTPGWFATYGTPVLAGRDFTPADREGSPPVAIVNEAFVRQFMGGLPPLGQTVIRNESFDADEPPVTIVGVVKDAAYRGMREAPPPTMYVPAAQRDMRPFYSVSLRSEVGAPSRLARSAVEAMTLVDGDLSLTARPLSDHVEAAFHRERLLALLAGFFGALALLLAGMGLYGVTAYSVSRRRDEIGIRMALGADTARVLRLVLGRVAVLVGLGVVLGGALSLWASTFVGTLLYGVEARDPVTFATAAAVLAVVGGVAAWVPARRAARIDPAQVLRDS